MANLILFVSSCKYISFKLEKTVFSTTFIFLFLLLSFCSYYFHFKVYVSGRITTKAGRQSNLILMMAFLIAVLIFTIIALINSSLYFINKRRKYNESLYFIFKGAN